MIEAGGMSEFVYCLDEGPPGEAFVAGIFLVEFRPESGETDEGAAASDYGLAEDEIQVRREDIRVYHAERLDTRALVIDELVENRAGPVLVSGVIAPIRIEDNGATEDDLGPEPLLQFRGEVLQDGEFNRPDRD